MLNSIGIINVIIIVIVIVVVVVVVSNIVVVDMLVSKKNCVLSVLGEKKKKNKNTYLNDCPCSSIIAFKLDML